MAVAVGVPFPSGVAALTAALTAVAFMAAIGTSIFDVTVWGVQSLPSSGKSFSPHDTSALVAVTAAVTAGTTCDHLDGFVVLALLPSLPSCIEPERSSTRNKSAGFLVSSN